MTASAESTARRAEHSQTGKTLIRVGLIAYGVVHLLVAWIALQIAWGGEDSGDEASSQGALQQMASTGIGSVLLWITVVGMAALVLWQAAEAIWGHRDVTDSGKKVRRRVASAGKAVIYAILGWNAASIALGAKSAESGSGGDTKEESLTASMMGSTFGRIVVIVVGAVVIGFGVRLVLRGIKKKFTRDLAGSPSAATVRLGQIGFVAKGIALAIVGGLLAYAALSYDPEKAGGLDDALRTVQQGPLGSVLLTLLALGIAAFGVYCFAWARHPKA